MATIDIVVQLGIIILTLSVFYLLTHKTLGSKLRSKSRASSQANRHFISGAQLLSRARSTSKNNNTSLSLANSALSEADKALLFLDPHNSAFAAAHILKALSLHHLGRRPAALRSLDAALSQKRSSLSDSERADALLKRAEIQLAVNKRRRADAAIGDVAEAVRLGAVGGKASCLMGRCYEAKGMREKAREAFEEALSAEPGYVPARQGLDRVRENTL